MDHVNFKENTMANTKITFDEETQSKIDAFFRGNRDQVAARRSAVWDKMREHMLGAVDARDSDLEVSSKPCKELRKKRKIKLVPEPEPELDPDRFWKATQAIAGVGSD